MQVWCTCDTGGLRAIRPPLHWSQKRAQSAPSRTLEGCRPPPGWAPGGCQGERQGASRTTAFPRKPTSTAPRGPHLSQRPDDVAQRESADPAFASWCWIVGVSRVGGAVCGLVGGPVSVLMRSPVGGLITGLVGRLIGGSVGGLGSGLTGRVGG